MKNMNSWSTYVQKVGTNQLIILSNYRLALFYKLVLKTIKFIKFDDWLIYAQFADSNPLESYGHFRWIPIWFKTNSLILLKPRKTCVHSLQCSQKIFQTCCSD